MSEIRELLPLYALGILEPAEAGEVERALAADPALAAELATLEDAAVALAAPVPPPAAVHARLLASIGGGPFERFSAQIASMFDVTVERARELLGLMARPASWEPAAPGVDLVHVAGGPACAAADCGFVRLAPGAAFPVHTHAGEEVSLILAGQLRDRTSGRIYRTGDEIVERTKLAHDVACEGDAPCLYAARVMNGIEIAGAPMRPPKK